MKNKRCIIMGIALIVFVQIYEYLLHGVILGPIYQATASVWRPEETMGAFIAWMMLGQVLFAIVFGLLYCCSKCRSSIADGAKFGLLVGLLMSSASFIYYAVLPIPMSLMVQWVIFGILETVLMGIIAAFILGEK